MMWGRKKTIVSTKLAEEDSLIFVGSADEMEQVVFQSEGGYFLRFQKQDISAMKKTSIGVRGMKLAEGDKLDHAYLLESRQEYTITYHDKPYVLNRIKLSKRDSKEEQNHVYKTNKSAKIKVFAGKALQLPEIGVTITKLELVGIGVGVSPLLFAEKEFVQK